MWEIHSGVQAVTFFAAFLLGALLSFIYDIIKSVRIYYKHGALAVFAEDFLFFVLSALLSFCLYIFTTEGQPRLYAYFAMALGFAVWRMTLSNFALILFRRIIRLLDTVFSKLKGGFYRLFDKICAKTQNFFKKLWLWAKKGLKEVKRIVYNLFIKIIGK
ncbi:MAG: spore cortex biosynthesis protein YabQ [Clostridia bacterium]|nr:spore cortex biosynthesis protein YabQ [Clostridia bacterium]